MKSVFSILMALAIIPSLGVYVYVAMANTLFAIRAPTDDSLIVFRNRAVVALFFYLSAVAISLVAGMRSRLCIQISILAIAFHTIAYGFVLKTYGPGGDSWDFTTYGIPLILLIVLIFAVRYLRFYGKVKFP